MGRGHHLAPAMLPGGLWLGSSSELELPHGGSVASLLALIILLIKQPGRGAGGGGVHGWRQQGDNGLKREWGATSTASHTRLSKEQPWGAGGQSPVGKGRECGVLCASCLAVPYGSPSHPPAAARFFWSCQTCQALRAPQDSILSFLS